MKNNPQQFALWLQGFLEAATTDEGLTAAQTQKISDKLNEVFEHEAEIPVKPVSNTISSKPPFGNELVRC